MGIFVGTRTIVEKDGSQKTYGVVRTDAVGENAEVRDQNKLNQDIDDAIAEIERRTDLDGAIFEPK